MVTAGIAALVVVLGPGVLSLMNVLTGAHAVLYRTVWVAPVSAAVGLLAAVPLPARARWVGVVPAAAIAAVVVVAGAPFWNAALVPPSWRATRRSSGRTKYRLTRNGRPGAATHVARGLKTIRPQRLRLVTAHLVEPADAAKRKILVSPVDLLHQQTPATTLRKSLTFDRGWCATRQRVERQMFRAAGYLRTTGMSAAGACAHHRRRNPTVTAPRATHRPPTANTPTGCSPAERWKRLLGARRCCTGGTSADYRFRTLDVGCGYRPPCSPRRDRRRHRPNPVSGRRGRMQAYTVRVPPIPGGGTAVL